MLRRLKVGVKRSSIIELEEILNFDKNICQVLEAGASDGVDTENMLNIFPITRIFVFEPVRQSHQLLKEKFGEDPRVELSGMALASKSGSSIMYVSSDSNSEFGSGSSSLLKPGLHNSIFPTIHFPSNEVQEVETITLDTWSGLCNVKSLDLLWLDLQGLELKVLQSGIQLLENTKMLHLELSRVALYEGGCTKKEVEIFLKAMQFKPKIVRVGTYTGNALYINTRFFK
jgi:FkbM family methyltransferase